jgi:hypothetical protein
LKSTNLNPYIIIWLINFISCWKQRVAVDGTAANFVNINRGVPQGTVLGPFLFSLMVNDIEVKYPQTNNMVKFTDDLTVRIPVTSSEDSALEEVTNILRVCNFYGYSQNEFTKLFDSLILSLFYYAIEVW